MKKRLLQFASIIGFMTAISLMATSVCTNTEEVAKEDLETIYIDDKEIVVDVDTYDIEANIEEYDEETLDVITNLQTNVATEEEAILANQDVDAQLGVEDRCLDGILGTQFGTEENNVNEFNDNQVKEDVEWLSVEELNSIEVGATPGVSYSDTFKDINLKHADLVKKYNKVFGVDVSHWQEDINWEKMKAAGVKFAIIKMGGRDKKTAKFYLDDYFKKNIEGAHAAGIDVGVYYFSQDLTEAEAKEAANWVVNQIKPYKSWITMPVFYDMEQTTGGRYVVEKMSKELRTNIWVDFCEIVKKAGYTPGVYASFYSYYSGYDSKGVLKDSTKLNTTLFEEKGYYIWLARYNWYTDSNRKCDMWQYSDYGSINGVPKWDRVDMNVAYVLNVPKVTGLKQSTVSAENTDTSLTLNWNASALVDGYYYQLLDSTGAVIRKGTVAAEEEKTSYSITLSELDAGTTYTARVKCYFLSGSIMESSTRYGSYCTAVSVKTRPADVTNETVGTNKGTSVVAKWTATKGAAGYRVYWYNEDNTLISSAFTTDTSYEITGLSPRTNYKTRVRPYTLINGSTKLYSPAYNEYVEFTTGTTAVTGLTVSVPSSTSKYNALDLKWKLQTGSEGYQVTCYDYATKKWATAVEVSDTTNSYQWKGLKGSTIYAFKVRSFFTSTKGTRVYGPYCTSIKYKTRPEKVAVSVSATTTSSIALKWNALVGADGYRIYRLNASTNKYELLADQKTTTYTNKNLKTGKKYTYKIAAYSLNASTRYYGANNIYEVATNPAKTTGLKFETAGVGDTYLTAKWTKVSGASGYQIRVYKSDGKTLYKTLTSTTNSLKITGLSAATVYKVKVHAFITPASGRTSYGSYSSLVTQTTRAKTVAAEVKSVSTTAISIQWDKVPGVSGYRIYSYNTSTKEYTLLKNVSSSTFSYTRSGLKAGKTYYFSVRPYRTYSGFTYMSAYGRVLTVATKPVTVTGLVRANATTDSVSLNWNAVSGASQYRVYCYNKSGTCVKSGFSSKNSYTMSGLAAGTYTFKVRAIRKTVDYDSYSAYSAAVEVCTKPEAITEVTVSDQNFDAEAGTATTTLSWDAVPNASGYRIELYDATGEKKLSMKLFSDASFIFEGQAIGQEYKVRVCAYTTVGGKNYYSDYKEFHYNTTE